MMVFTGRRKANDQEKYPDRKDKNQLQAEPSCNTGSWNHTIFPEVFHEAMSIPLTDTLMDTSRRELLKLEVHDVSRNFTQLSNRSNVRNTL